MRYPGVWLLAHVLHSAQRLQHLLWAAVEEVVIAWCDPGRRAAMTAAVYSRQEQYAGDSAHNRRGLWSWEEDAVDRYFPPPPARVLVAACGGGRQVRPLLELGYHVAAFEPNPRLVAGARQRLATAAGLLAVEQGSFEQFARDPTCLPGIEGAAPYDAVLLGWGSFSHLLDLGAAVELLRALRRACEQGPIVMSFLSSPGVAGMLSARRRRFRTVLQRLHVGPALPDTGVEFSPWAGFYRRYSEQELARCAVDSGSTVALYKQGSYPHAVLVPCGSRADSAPSG